MPEVKLIYNEEKEAPCFNIGVMLDRKPTKGEVGIEIECEGKNLPHENATPAPWGYHVDHSLRGDDNGEYVLTQPIMFSEVPAAIKILWDRFEQLETVLDNSNRTSVHIHLNCQEFHLNRLTSFLAAWFCLEEILVEFCGEHRVGNLFCLRAVDAPAVIGYIRRFIRTDGLAGLEEHLHYAAMNPNALQKYGSLEIRTLRGCSDPQLILDWIAILERLYKLSENYPDPRELVSMFSSGGPLGFFDILLGDKAELVKAGVSMNQNEIVEAMMRGIRFAQDIVYCRDWDKYQPMKIAVDPFGRSARKVASKLMNEAHMLSEPTAGYGPEAPDHIAVQPIPLSGVSASLAQAMQDAQTIYTNLGAQAAAQAISDEPFDPFHLDSY